jgi:hypothetical protein
MIVREPMERLASCYNDKMITNTAPILTNKRAKIKFLANKLKGIEQPIFSNTSDTSVSFDDFLVAFILKSRAGLISFTYRYNFF